MATDNSSEGEMPHCSTCGSEAVTFCNYHKLSFCKGCASVHEHLSVCYFTAALPLRLVSIRQLALKFKKEEHDQ